MAQNVSISKVTDNPVAEAEHVKVIATANSEFVAAEMLARGIVVSGKITSCELKIQGNKKWTAMTDEEKANVEFVVDPYKRDFNGNINPNYKRAIIAYDITMETEDDFGEKYEVDFTIKFGCANDIINKVMTPYYKSQTRSIEQGLRSQGIKMIKAPMRFHECIINQDVTCGIIPTSFKKDEESGKKMPSFWQISFDKEYIKHQMARLGKTGWTLESENKEDDEDEDI